MAERNAIVVDLGSQDLKAGYAYGWPNPEEPRLVSTFLLRVLQNNELDLINSNVLSLPPRMPNPGGR